MRLHANNLFHKCDASRCTDDKAGCENCAITYKLSCLRSSLTEAPFQQQQKIIEVMWVDGMVFVLFFFGVEVPLLLLPVKHDRLRWCLKGETSFLCTTHAIQMIHFVFCFRFASAANIFFHLFATICHRRLLYRTIHHRRILMLIM